MAYILAINPGSTSTKIALFEGEKEVFTKTLRHSSEEISQYERVIDQLEFREKTILAALEENGVSLSDIAVIVGRGGLLRPIPSGVYEVNDAMTADLASACYGEHASNLGTPATSAVSWPRGLQLRQRAAGPSSPIPSWWTSLRT